MAIRRPPKSATLSRRCGSRPVALVADLPRRLPTPCRTSSATAGSCARGCRGDLDEARRLRDDSRQVVATLQARYAAETDLRTLRVKHNNVLGYFIEVSPAGGEKLLAAPLNARFIHRQTLAGAVRFTTTELADLEVEDRGRRRPRAHHRARGIRCAGAAQIAAAADAIRAVADALAVLDVAAALAVLAEDEGYCRPIVDTSLAFAIAGGRHPVVEQALRQDGTGSATFVANDCDLSPAGGDDAGRIFLVTGPNMAGKSTYLRQNALIAILAQAGSYVPARTARIGIVDRLFSRVGAADDLARGRSTFMVEMIETAAILNQAGERALVILDEIGRGTATFDGLSIAWAAVEHLHDVNKCRALFATHYHELTALARRLPRLQQRHGARQGMEGRRRVPARDRARHRRPLLWHPGGAAGRAAGVGDRAGAHGAQAARGDGPQVAGARGHRRPAAVRIGRAGRGGPAVRSARRSPRHDRAGRAVAARGAGGALQAQGGAEEGGVMIDHTGFTGGGHGQVAGVHEVALTLPGMGVLRMPRRRHSGLDEL